jgi:2-hydroxy-3-keto-5-methylthiopentenyl-1-phosphate phosphatase
MEMPVGSPCWSPTLGVDKTGIVRDLLNQGTRVAFAGDGFPDAEPARLVPAALRFARGDLADVLRQEKLPFHPFESWSDIADQLIADRRVAGGG